jgi:hypothetical protein
MGLEQRLAKLAILVPKGLGNQTADTLQADVTHNVTVPDPCGRHQKFDKVTPLLEEPAIEPFTTHFGGGRTYGGGFSKEAKRRAKRKDNNTDSS